MSMSTTAQISLAAVRRAQLAGVIQRASSRGLFRLAGESKLVAGQEAGLGDLSRLSERVNAIREERTLAEALDAVAPKAMSIAARGLAASRRALADGDGARAGDLARAADLTLRDGVLAAARGAAREEHHLAASLADQSLRAIGANTTRATVGDRTGIWAARGHQLVAVRVADGGRVKIDYAGCSAGECAPLHHEFAQALAAAGGVLEDSGSWAHGDVTGGELIHRAGAIAGTTGDMARAIACQGDENMDASGETEAVVHRSERTRVS